MHETETRRRMAVLRLIEGDVVPQLADVYRRRNGTPCAMPRPLTMHEHVVAFAAAALRGDVAAMKIEIARQERDGLTNESILLDFLAPSVRHLGDMWLEDRCSFCDVTLGVTQVLQQMHALLSRSCSSAWSDRRSIALWPVPGDMHTFGSAMLSGLFRLRGWSVHHTALDDPILIPPVLGVRSFSVVGFSLGDPRLLYVLEECIRAARLTSRNREVIVMVGGPAFAAQNGLADGLDVDVVANGAEEALLQAELLLERDPIVPFPAPRLAKLAASHGVVGWSG